MASKTLLCVSSRAVTVALWQRGKIVSCESLANDESGWSSFGQMLLRHPTNLVYLMVDAVEEDYRIETLPHVIGSGRREMLQRKLGQIFRATLYRTAWLLGREPDKRRDDRYLFASMNNAELLRPWLEIIKMRRAPLAGIYLLPLLSQALLSRLHLKEPNILLVSLQGGGLRQSFFQEQKLKISRLTQLEDPENFSAAVGAAEVEKTRAYLYNMRLLPRDAKLAVYVLDQDGSLSVLCSKIAADTNLACSELNRIDIVHRLKISPRILHGCIDTLHLYALAKYPPAYSLAAPGMLVDFHYHQMRRVILAASLSLFAGTLAWGSANLYQEYSLQSKTTRTGEQTRKLESLYDEAARRFPSAPASAENLRRAVETAALLRQYSHTPQRLMQIVSHAIGDSADVSLNRLTWSYGSNGAEHTSGAPATSSAPPVSPGGGDPALPATWRQTGYIEGEIKPFKGDYRAAIASVNAFAAQLRQDKEVEDVTILQLPLNFDPKAGLSGNTLDSANSQTAVATFKVKIVLRQTP